MMRGLGLIFALGGLVDPFDEIVRRHVGTIAARFGAFFGPREMAFLTVVFFFHQADIGGNSHSQVGEE